MGPGWSTAGPELSVWRLGLADSCSGQADSCGWAGWLVLWAGRLMARGWLTRNGSVRCRLWPPGVAELRSLALRALHVGSRPALQASPLVRLLPFRVRCSSMMKPLELTIGQRGRGVDIADAERSDVKHLNRELHHMRCDGRVLWRDLVVKEEMLPKRRLQLLLAADLLRWRHGSYSLPPECVPSVISYLVDTFIFVSVPTVLLPPYPRPSNLLPCCVRSIVEAQRVEVRRILVRLHEIKSCLEKLDDQCHSDIWLLVNKLNMPYGIVRACVSLGPEVSHENWRRAFAPYCEPDSDTDV